MIPVDSMRLLDETAGGELTAMAEIVDAFSALKLLAEVNSPEKLAAEYSSLIEFADAVFSTRVAEASVTRVVCSAAHATFRRDSASLHLDGQHQFLTRTLKSLEADGANERLEREADEFAAQLLAERAIAAVWDETFNPFIALPALSSPPADPLLFRRLFESAIERFERLQRRAVWIALDYFQRRIREEIRRRLRVLRQRDTRTTFQIVLVHIAWFLTHGCHPPPARRSCVSFRDACTC